MILSWEGSEGEAEKMRSRYQFMRREERGSSSGYLAEMMWS